MTTKASHFFRCEGRRLRLERSIPGFLGFGRPRVESVPLDQWQDLCPAAAREALALLWNASADLVQREDESLLVDPVVIAAMPAAQVAVLDLPARLPLTLTVTVQGQVHLKSFALDACWTSGTGTRERVVEQDGVLRWEGRYWHAPAWAPPIQGAIRQVNQAHSMGERAEAMARLQALLDDHADAPISVDRQVADLRIRHAAGLALQITIEDGMVRFAPVLFSRDYTQMALAGDILDEANDSLLIPALARDWVSRALAGPGRDTYLLRDGSIMVLDPALSRVVGGVAQAALLAPEDRRAFVIAPHSLLAEACGLSRDAIDAVLVETTQYASAVRQLDLWRRPVRPWLALGADGNAVAAQGLCLGEEDDLQWLELPADQLSMILAQADVALASRQANFNWGGWVLPATAAVRSSLRALLGLVTASLGDEPSLGNLANNVFWLRDDQSGIVASGPLRDLLAKPSVQPAPLQMAPVWPHGLTLNPVPHQQASFAWLTEHWLTHAGGAIWADAPGLGAKLPLMAFLTWLSHQSSLPSMLIVATCDIADWHKVLASLAPDLAARTQLVADAHVDETVLSVAGLVLTTYEMVRDFPQMFARQPFAALMLDKAEQMYSPAGQTARAVQMLDAHLRVARITPLLDRRQESLRAVFKVVKGDAELADLAQAPWLLHRRREDCQQSLPPCKDHVVAMAMPSRQREAYENLLHRAQALRGCEDPARMEAMLDQLEAVSCAAFVPGEEVADLAQLSGRIAGLFQTLPAILALGEQAIVICHDTALGHALRPVLQDRFGPGVTLVDPSTRDKSRDMVAANHLLLLTRASHPADHDAIVAYLHRLGQPRPVHVYWLQSVHPDPSWAPSSLDVLRDQALRDRCGGLFLPPKDSAMLFDTVVAALPETAAIPLQETPSPRVPVAPPQPPAAPPRKTGRLSLGERAIARPAPLNAAMLADIASTRVAPQSSVLEIPPPSRWATRVEFMEGGKRDTSIFRAPLQNDPPTQCRVIDPYAAAGAAARRRTVDFLSMLLGPKPTLAAVTLETFDGAGLDRDDPEDDEAQKADMQRQWLLTYPNGPALHFKQHSRRTTKRIMHDRNVTVVTQSGRKLIWDMGRGIDGVMGTYYRCVVTLTEI